MAVYIILFSYNLPWWQGASEPTHLTLGAALFQAPFRWWFVSSLLGFLVVLLFWVADRVVHMLRWAFKRVAGKRLLSSHRPEATDPVSRGRRQFLEKAAVAISASPFVAGAYFYLYGRDDVPGDTAAPQAFQGSNGERLSGEPTTARSGA